MMSPQSIHLGNTKQEELIYISDKLLDEYVREVLMGDLQ